jgi:hypothetical protein
MKTSMKFLAACSAVALPLAVSAQSNDAAYCAKLSKLYREAAPQLRDTSVTVPVAMAKCAVGDTANGIPVLEQALKNQGVTLPPRT